LTIKNRFISKEEKKGFSAVYERILNIQSEWQRFISTGSTANILSIRPEVLSSWKRSYERGIDPYHIRTATITPEELARRLESNRTLLEVSIPLLEAFGSNIEGSDFRVDLIDSDLFILKQFGEKKVLETAAGCGSTPGVSRAESQTGTNAICLAAILRRPIQLVGPEHYNERLQQLTCSATPLVDNEGKLLGVLNLAGPYERVQLHTLGMTVALGRAIELSYLQAHLLNEKELAHKYIESIVDSISDGLVALNEKSRISVLNKNAGKILDLRRNDVIDHSAEEFFDPDSTIIQTLKSGEAHVDKELVFSRNNKRKMVIGTCLPVSIKEGTKSVLCVFKELSRARGFVKNLAGFKAYFTLDDLKGKSTNFINAINFARHTAPLPSNILLLGESGTGKELFAQGIHNASQAKNGPFIAINCGAIPAGLIESELFGYEGGAFTGARREGQQGKLELAEDGTLFLDDIDCMPVGTQVTLLRILQNRCFTRIGGTHEILFNARIIVASNKDLWKEVRDGSFRKDLFYRINVITIEIPPLRERKEDIYELGKEFTRRWTDKLGATLILSNKALAMMVNYPWPGNVRELENVIERCAIIAHSRGSTQIEERDLLTYQGFHLSDDTKEDPSGIAGVASLDQMERETILRILSSMNNNISAAAKKLGVTRGTLYNKMRKYNIPFKASQRI